MADDQRDDDERDHDEVLDEPIEDPREDDDDDGPADAMDVIKPDPPQSPAAEADHPAPGLG